MGDAQRHGIPRNRVVDVALVVSAGAVDLAFWNGSRELAGGGVLPLWVVPFLSAVMCSLLLLRQRHPIPVWVAQAAYTGINFLIPAYYPFAYLLVASYAVAARKTMSVARWILPAAAVPFALFSYHSAQTAASGQQAAREFLVAAGIWTMFMSIAWTLGRLAYTREQQARAVQARMAEEAEQALAAQRLQLAHELHDSVSGAVAGMVLYAGAARAVAAGADPRTHDALEAIEKTGQQAIGELHALLGLLRSTDTVKGHSEKPRSQGIDELVELTRKGGIEVRFDHTGSPAHGLDPDIDLAVYRIVQESLTNIIKHAGRDAVAAVDIEWGARTVIVTVESGGGRGSADTAKDLSSGQGLRGLGERIEALGGSLEFGPVDAGWRVNAELPLTASNLSRRSR
ncbi:two-component sensor histidine kinase [Nocardia sp. NEAU-351]|uniref:histidine kinase n=1 Tax=Nocardia bovistercoris TaxID=2785916 RepID=A0A931N647_9NOCA|nr:two-component sensor histidine kinase [Nocardia bovistercoris]